MNGLNTSNAWVFISHSNKDFEKIRLIRNKLETMQYKPLLFFLKCLEEEEEISDLIKREIFVRDRFILCDSKNARESVWVQNEKNFILSLNRPYEVIDLDGTEKDIEESLARFDMRSSIYVWSTDVDLGRRVANNLISKSFKTGLLPYSFFKDYYYFSSGSPDLVGTEFVFPEKKSYFIIVIDRILTKEEIRDIETISPSIKRGGGFQTLRVFIVSESETKRKEITNGNKDLLYPFYQDGIHPRYITCRNKNQSSNLILQDIIDLDSYQYHLLKKTLPLDFYIELKEYKYNQTSDSYQLTSTLFTCIEKIHKNQNIEWIDVNCKPASSTGNLFISEITEESIKYEYSHSERTILKGILTLSSMIDEYYVYDGVRYSFNLNIISLSDIRQLHHNFSI